ncbi:MAG: hypothetical protein JWO36_613 [Myxococcales bacterium]|nr:hypothetical protein [Myxococcales bacterium]
MCLIVLVSLALPAMAAAKPRVAVAPFEGDSEDKVSDVVAEEAEKSAKVTGPEEVGRVMESLAISDARSMRALKKLRVRLEVDVVVHGKVERDGSKKRLEVTVSGRAKKSATFEVKFKTTSSKAFRKELRDELVKRIASATEGEARDDDTDEDDEPKKKKPSDDDEPKKKKLSEDDEPKKKPSEDDEPKKKKSSDDDEPRKKKSSEDDEPRKKRVADDDSKRVRKHHDDDDDDSSSHKKKRKRHHDDDEADEPDRHPVTQAALWLDAGGFGLRRTLKYDSTGNTAPPPKVGTGSFGGQLEGEVYPLAFSGGPAGFGIAGSLRRTVGLSIAVPNTTMSAPIKEGHYSIGARYRLVFGSSSLALGVSYWHSSYVADRSGLMTPTQLDMPDVEYSAVAPGAVAKIAATPKIGVMLGADVPLMLSTGPIGAGTSYGKATILSFALTGGVEVALAPNYGLHFAAIFEQVGLSFKADAGSQAASRGVTAATDRTVGVTASFAVIY